jgi:hypothetical protein
VAVRPDGGGAISRKSGTLWFFTLRAPIFMPVPQQQYKFSKRIRSSAINQVGTIMEIQG